jgi:hypothetical protein
LKGRRHASSSSYRRLDQPWNASGAGPWQSDGSDWRNAGVACRG